MKKIALLVLLSVVAFVFISADRNAERRYKRFPGRSHADTPIKHSRANIPTFTVNITAILINAANYPGLDLSEEASALKQLTRRSYSGNRQLIDTLLKHPNDHNPVVIYNLSSVLFKAGRKDEALFWLHVALIRCKYDINRCNDETVAATSSMLYEQFWPQMRPYAVSNIDTLKKIVDHAIDFVRNNREDYDPRWMNLTGLNAMFKDPQGLGAVDKMSKPEETWPSLKTEAIQTFSNNFNEFLKYYEKQ